MKYFILFLMVILIPAQSFSQKTISGKSSPTRIKLLPKYERGLPPNLYVDMVFSDQNNNKLLEASETANLKLKITNKGSGKAQGLVVNVQSNKYDSDLKIGDNKKIPYLMPGQSIEVTIPFTAGFDINTNEHKFTISVTEYFGFDMDPAYLILNTFAYQPPKLVFSGLDIIDIGEGTGAIIQDAQLQAGEQVKVKIVVQNVGQNISEGTLYGVSTSDKNIYINDASGYLGDIGIGQVKEFWVTITPNKRVTNTGELPIFLTLSNKHQKGNINKKRLPIRLNQKPPETAIVEVKTDIERLRKQVARFEYTSNKITANVGNVIDIKQVPPAKTRRPDAIAVVIGVEDYDNFAPAPYADNDADIIKEYFKIAMGVNKVYTYTNDEVSGFFFDNTFNPDYGELQKAIVKEQTDLFVFYSGHGMPSKDGSKVFLFPSDGRIEALTRQGYDLNKFYNNLQDLGARSVTVFMDACFSGASRSSGTYRTENLVAMKGVAIKPDVMHPWENNPGFTVFTSSGYNETSLGFDPAETGLFTYYLCAGLQGNADINGDKRITAGELKVYINKNVMETSTKVSGLQTPQFYGNEDLVITEY